MFGPCSGHASLHARLACNQGLQPILRRDGRLPAFSFDTIFTRYFALFFDIDTDIDIFIAGTITTKYYF